MQQRLFAKTLHVPAVSVTKFKSELIQASRPYQYVSFMELLNSYGVFKLSSYPFLVRNVPTFISLAKQTNTSFILHWAVKNTFFKHFCGGENLSEVIPAMERLAKSNLGTILDLAMEADLDAEEKSGLAAKISAREIADQLRGAIDIAAHQDDSFVAVKVTSMVPPAVLYSFSSTLNKLKQASLDLSNGSGELSLGQFKKLSDTFPGLNQLDLDRLFAENDLDKDGLLNYADLAAIFSVANPVTCKALLTDAGVQPNDRNLSARDLETLKYVLEEIDYLCEYAKKNVVKLMMDAEQSYFQPAIDNVILSLARKHNVKIGEKSEWKGPMVFNTYQMYLVDSLGRLQADAARAEQEQYTFGVKLVRGAYMESERKRAEVYGYASPIHRDIESSHNSFNAAIEFVIQKQASTTCSREFSDLCLVVATHNQDSIELATELMERNAVPKTGGWVSFGQLLGMQDGTTGQLARSGFQVFKYVPYGPVPVVLPYLHRRAEENSTMMKAMEADKAAIAKEIKYRLFG
jgi:proline dehydrogenase